MTPPIDPNFLSPTGTRIMPAPSFPTAGDTQPAMHLGPTGESPRSPEGQGISRESRQDLAAFTVLCRLGKSEQEAHRLVAGMQARRRELAGVHCQTVAPKVELRTTLPVEVAK